MRIIAIKLCPFAGLADTSVSFNAELTVIRGDNEAGKSTVMRALDSVLLVRTDLPPSKMREFCRPYLPAGGGDTIVVELDFEHDSERYRLRRRWGNGAEAQLTLPGGMIVTGEPAIITRLEPMLAVPAGTYRSVLLAPQSGLAGTVTGLKKDGGGSLRDLSDILMSAVQETDGVSVDALKIRIQAQYDEYFSHWDIARAFPEGGRGLQNPWKKEVGRVLLAWYAMEAAKLAHKEAVDSERKIDQLNGRISELSHLCGDLDAYVKSHKAVAASVAERKLIEARETLVNADMVRYKQANAEWPRLEQVVKDLAAKRDELTAKVAQLAAEKKRAIQAEACKGVAEKLKRVDLQQQRLNECRHALAAARVLPRAALEEILRTLSRARELQGALAAGRLTACFTAKAPMAVSLQCGADPAHPESLSADASRSFDADGRFRIEHPQWTLEVESGKGKFAALAVDLEKARVALSSLFAKYGAADEEDARRLSAAYEAATNAVAAAEKNLAAELNGQTYEGLAASMILDKNAAEPRPLAQVAEDVVTAGFQLETATKELGVMTTRLDELTSTYGDTNRLVDGMLELLQTQKQLQGQRAALAPLPAGVADADGFLADYERRKTELTAATAQKNDLDVQRAGIPAPEDSSEELGVRCADLQEAFAAALRRGAVVCRIQQAVADAERAAAAADPYTGLKQSLEKYIACMTAGRYEQIRMADGLPSGFVRRDGVLVGADLLSTGTSDVLGLALRLTMASYFLGEKGGFLVMDDPLVDLDPVRQAAAAELLREYARKRQLIVFTCHPAHAGLLTDAPTVLG